MFTTCSFICVFSNSEVKKFWEKLWIIRIFEVTACHLSSLSFRNLMIHVNHLKTQFGESNIRILVIIDAIIFHATAHRIRLLYTYYAVGWVSYYIIWWAHVCKTSYSQFVNLCISRSGSSRMVSWNWRDNHSLSRIKM